LHCVLCRANLSAAQIVEQVVAARRLLAADDADATCGGITNVVFMGMGEPLHNLDAVLAAVDIMTDPHGLQMSHNKVSTLQPRSQEQRIMRLSTMHIAQSSGSVACRPSANHPLFLLGTLVLAIHLPSIAHFPCMQPHVHAA
jgi:adenine C2-methylase RlmN of 23S rRNA A2503 and tRNA A37